MRTLQTFILVLAICFSGNANAQLLKKLKKKAEEAAERTIERKVEEKTEKETEKVFDSTFNNQGKIFKKSAESPSDNYTFSHKYIMEIAQGKNTNQLVYYLTNEGNYMGSAVEMKENEQMITVMDLSKKTAYNFMDFGDVKSMMSFGLDFEEIVENTQENSGMSIEATGNTKTILGYSCDEYKVNGDNLHGTIWVTQDAPISFSDAFSKVKSKNKNIDQSWMSMTEGLTMEMDMTDTSKKKPKNILMRCIALDETDFTIETAQYKKTF